MTSPDPYAGLDSATRAAVIAQAIQVALADRLRAQTYGLGLPTTDSRSKYSVDAVAVYDAHLTALRAL